MRGASAPICDRPEPAAASRSSRRHGCPSPRSILALSIFLPSRRPACGATRSSPWPTRPRVTQTVVVVRPPGKPVATVVVLVGGAGKLDLTPRGLPRDAPGLSRDATGATGRSRFVVALPDAPSDRLGEGLLGFRTSREHSVDIGAVIARLRHDDPVPVWLVGTSMGTVSAASAAARLGRDGPDGLVLDLERDREPIPTCANRSATFPWRASACRRSSSTTGDDRVRDRRGTTTPPLCRAG